MSEDLIIFHEILEEHGVFPENYISLFPAVYTVDISKVFEIEVESAVIGERLLFRNVFRDPVKITRCVEQSGHKGSCLLLMRLFVLLYAEQIQHEIRRIYLQKKLFLFGKWFLVGIDIDHYGTIAILIKRKTERLVRRHSVIPLKKQDILLSGRELEIAGEFGLDAKNMHAVCHSADSFPEAVQRYGPLRYIP